jgi:hypothetical protein
MRRFLWLLLGVSLLLAGCATTGEISPACPELTVSPEARESLKDAGQAVPFRLVLPCERRFALTHVQWVQPPGVSRHEQQQRHPDWRYLRLNFRAGDSGHFTLLESNGNIHVEGQQSCLAGHDVVVSQTGAARQLWVDLGGLQVVVESESLSAPELEAIATDLIRQVDTAPRACP